MTRRRFGVNASPLPALRVPTGFEVGELCARREAAPISGAV